eukprot:2592211-Amphidinium_carterae.1
MVCHLFVRKLLLCAQQYWYAIFSSLQLDQRWPGSGLHRCAAPCGRSGALAWPALIAAQIRSDG